MLDIGSLLSVGADVVSISAAFDVVANLLAGTVAGRNAVLLNAGTTLPTASVDGEIDRIFNGGAPFSTAAVRGGTCFFNSGTPLSAAAVGGGIGGVFDVEDTLLTSVVDGLAERVLSVEDFFAAGILALF